MLSEFESKNSDLASRRIFLKCGLVACAAADLAPGISGQTFAAPYYKAIFDERFEEPRVFAAGATKRGIRTAAIQGDVTRLFFNDLDLRWKHGPIRLAGYTTPASLFCLDLLARDRGMRVSRCVTNAKAGLALGLLDGLLPLRWTTTTRSNSSGLVCWIIAPKSRIRPT